MSITSIDQLPSELLLSILQEALRESPETPIERVCQTWQTSSQRWVNNKIHDLVLFMGLFGGLFEERRWQINNRQLSLLQRAHQEKIRTRNCFKLYRLIKKEVGALEELEPMVQKGVYKLSYTHCRDMVGELDNGQFKISWIDSSDSSQDSDILLSKELYDQINCLSKPLFSQLLALKQKDPEFTEHLQRLRALHLSYKANHLKTLGKYQESESLDVESTQITRSFDEKQGISRNTIVSRTNAVTSLWKTDKKKEALSLLNEAFNYYQIFYHLDRVEAINVALSMACAFALTEQPQLSIKCVNDYFDGSSNIKNSGYDLEELCVAIAYMSARKADWKTANSSLTFLEQLDHLELTSDVWDSKNARAYVFDKMGFHEQAVDWGRKALKIPKIDPELEMRLKYQVGKNLIYIGKFEEALSYFAGGCIIARKHQKDDTFLLEGLCTTYIKKNAYPQAKEYCNELLEKQQAGKSPEIFKGRVQILRSLLSQEYGDAREVALNNLKIASEGLDSTQNPNAEIADLYGMIGSAFTKLDGIALARDCYQKALAIKEYIKKDHPDSVKIKEELRRCQELESLCQFLGKCIKTRNVAEALLKNSISELGKINNLDLSSCQLDEIPNAFDCLTRLRGLNLNSNHFSQPAREINKLSQLKLVTLDFAYQHNLSELPQELGSITSLISLNIAGNQLTSLPSTITQLVQLKSLDLRGNRFKSVPQELLTMASHLKQLYLSGNPLEEIPFQLEKVIVRPLPSNAKWVD